MQQIEATPTFIIKLDAGRIAKLFEDEFDGWCPVCRNEPINVGEIICDNCFAIAERQRRQAREAR